MRYTIKQLLRCFFIVSIVLNIYFLHQFKIKWNDRRTWLKIFQPMYVTSSRNMLKKRVNNAINTYSTHNVSIIVKKKNKKQGESPWKKLLDSSQRSQSKLGYNKEHKYKYKNISKQKYISPTWFKHFNKNKKPSLKHISSTWFKHFKNNKKPSLKYVLMKACTRWLTRFNSIFHHVKLSKTFAFMKYHKIHYTLSDGSLLAFKRFNLFSSPWDDDVDTTAPLDEVERIYTVKDVPGKYKDITKTSFGQAIHRRFCRGRAHIKVCIKVRVISLLEETNSGGTPDCISFEALRWGFLHVRYHIECKPGGGLPTLDLFIHYKCMNNESENCRQGRNDFYGYLHGLKNVRPGRRFGVGFRPEWFDILMDPNYAFQKVVVSGVETYVPQEGQIVKYLNGIYPGWDKRALICPHNLFWSFAQCNTKTGKSRMEYPIKEATRVMEDINDCKTVLDMGK